ncbi:maltokinase N-terminal cap-like domain-containing protein [Microbispora sp. H10949]|uniref:maltokinase N-terminal cap-like domain-containing protein n=1 Tax=Microbispora sp. H10949 TaxID=2729111 RepID=UPI0016029081|nr:1,4-alpha-glucan branching protein [Microbispora sp. H10949]
MAVIHKTMLTPGKLELLTAWLPARSWYEGGERRPELARAGGFRLDDPQGEVGIEFMVVTDESGDEPVSYLVPLSYRGAPLDGADHALIGTTEHGVLGSRWVYDGAHDPVLVAQLLALLLGEAEPQAQSVSNTPDPSVVSDFTGPAITGPIMSTTATDGPRCTDIVVRAGSGEDPQRDQDGRLVIRVNRVLRPGEEDATGAQGHVTAGWRLPDGTETRAVFAVVPDAAP